MKTHTPAIGGREMDMASPAESGGTASPKSESSCQSEGERLWDIFTGVGFIQINFEDDTYDNLHKVVRQEFERVASEFLHPPLSSEVPPISPSIASAGNIPPDELSNLRDETARIVDPEAWDEISADDNEDGAAIFAEAWEIALAKADQIQALYVGLGRGLGASVAESAAAGPAACAASEAAGKSEEDWPLPAGVPTYEDALKLVLHFRKPSVSFIQRKLQIGYNKACDFIEIMEAKGIVSKSNSAGVRTMLPPLNPDRVMK